MEHSNTDTNDNAMHHTSILGIILGNAKWLLVLLFTPTVNYMIAVFPEWKDGLENFKLIGGSIIIILVIFKLLLEIVKLIKGK